MLKHSEGGGGVWLKLKISMIDKACRESNTGAPIFLALCIVYLMSVLSLFCLFLLTGTASGSPTQKHLVLIEGFASTLAVE